MSLVNPQLIPEGQSWPVNTRTKATGINVPVVIASLFLSGFALPGDGGAAEYKRVAVQPSHPGKFQSNDGAWWEITSRSLFLEQFGAKRDNSTDDSQAIEDAIATYYATNADGVYPLAGTYKVTRGFTFNNEIRFRGTGKVRTTFNYTGAARVSVFKIDCPNNASIIGFDIGSFTVSCGYAGDAIEIYSLPPGGGNNSANSTSNLTDIFIFECKRGVWIGGVTYQCNFENITVVFTTEHGFYADGPNWGDVVYNRFKGLEVTGCQDGAYAYYIHSNYSTFEQLTCDGAWHISDPNGDIVSITIEGMPNNPPSGVAAGTIDLIGSARNITFTNVPNAKCNIGLDLNANDVLITNVLFNGAVGPAADRQPNTPIFFRTGNAGYGIVQNVTMLDCVNKLSRGQAGNYTLINCNDITDYSYHYKESEWTPVVNSWSTPPVIDYAHCIENGNLITLTIGGHGGRTGASGPGVGGGIGALPVSTTLTGGGFAIITCNDPSKTVFGNVNPSTNYVGPFGTVDYETVLTYWVCTVTYSRN